MSKQKEPVVSFLLTPHMPGCYAAEMWRTGEWPTPWSLPTRTIWRARDGSRRGGGGRTPFVVVACNNASCPGEKAIHHEAVAKIGDEGLVGAPPTRSA